MATQAPFALGTFSIEGDAAPCMVLSDEVFDLRPALGREVTVRSMVDSWDSYVPQLQRLADHSPDQTALPLATLRPLPPLQPTGQIFQAAANYRQHVLDLLSAADARGDSSDGVAEADRPSERELLDARAAQGRPFVFLGSSHAIIGATDDITLPADSDQSDWELELAAVIGRPGRRVAVENALDLVAGYMIANDLTSRDALARWDAGALGIDWLAGKNSPSFLPLGPLLVPAIHVGDPQNLHVTLKVNGQTMQDESTSDMLFSVAALITYISTVAEVRPGDVILTGSPAGNGAAHGVFLRPGDVVDGFITGLGSQRNRCVAEILNGSAS
ncbi:fumarylacetoacetate hydrolase family protein [Streptomyces mirabilis]|uniref:fumarylacetoacetate hydrolase family protein n=1 Tax=Streptomyces mirabilis TaxID=68239 RepID=UPI003408CB6B